MALTLRKLKSGWALGLILFCCLSAGESFAARKFHIELIVFAQHGPNSEKFVQSTSRVSWPSNLAELTASSATGALRRTENKVLGSVYGQLSRSSAYRPLLHVAWIQEVKKNSKSPPVHVFQSGGTGGGYPVNGFVRLERGHYIHLSVDMEYAGSSLIYRLHERRRLLLNEIHYLDHPRFGIIATVRPVGETEGRDD
ncbi:MAG: CsiV family protein [Gammaproteobacteria bacterium]